jgi:thioredoxin-dependent peroxiredoxin
LNALVVGVSADKPATQQKFIDKFGLTFPLVSDPGKTVIDAYGAREVLGVTAKRSTFLVGPDGRIAQRWTKVTIEGHAEDVIGAIRRLSAASRSATG